MGSSCIAYKLGIIQLRYDYIMIFMISVDVLKKKKKNIPDNAGYRYTSLKKKKK